MNPNPANKMNSLGPRRAMDVDRRFQRQLQDQWERELGHINYMATIQSRQLAQLFEFLQSEGSTSESSTLSTDAQRYVPAIFTNIESVEAEQLKGAPHVDLGGGFELSGERTIALRDLLQKFAALSRPGRPLTELTKKDFSESERVYRATFCRFLLDCKLSKRLAGSGRWNSYSHQIRS